MVVQHPQAGRANQTRRFRRIGDLRAPDRPLSRHDHETVGIQHVDLVPGQDFQQLVQTTRPVLELKGFARVPLDPGRSARVTFAVPVELAAFTGVDLARVVEPGRLEVAVGASSADLRLRGSVEVVGEVRPVGEDRALTSSSTVAPA